MSRGIQEKNPGIPGKPHEVLEIGTYKPARQYIQEFHEKLLWNIRKDKENYPP